MAPPQRSKLRQGVEPCRFECNGKDDAERRRQNKGSGNGETKANRALIVSGSRRLPRRETLVLWADDGLRPAQAGSARPIQGNFMDMPDRKPELQCESQQRKPRAETAWYRSNALDHSFRCSRPNLSPTPLPIGNHYRGAHQVALAKLHRGYARVRGLERDRRRPRCERDINDFGQRHLAMVRSLVIAPAQMHPHALWRDRGERMVQRLDMESDPVAEFLDRQVGILDVPAPSPSRGS